MTAAEAMPNPAFTVVPFDGIFLCTSGPQRRKDALTPQRTGLLFRITIKWEKLGSSSIISLFFFFIK